MNSAQNCTKHTPTLNEIDLYNAIRVVSDSSVDDINDGDYYYDIYCPALYAYEVGTTNIADTVWRDVCLFDVNIEWPLYYTPPVMTETVKKGIRAGYLWAKTELANG